MINLSFSASDNFILQFKYVIMIHLFIILMIQHGCYTCLHKYHSLEDWKKFAAEHPDALPYVAASAGTAEGDFNKLCEILNNIEGVNFICLDVANGYSQFFVEFVEKVRKEFPSHTIMVSEFFVYHIFTMRISNITTQCST